jgi:hypothetical protein
VPDNIKYNLLTKYQYDITLTKWDVELKKLISGGRGRLALFEALNAKSCGYCSAGYLTTNTCIRCVLFHEKLCSKATLGTKNMPTFWKFIKSVEKDHFGHAEKHRKKMVAFIKKDRARNEAFWGYNQNTLVNKGEECK